MEHLMMDLYLKHVFLWFYWQDRLRDDRKQDESGGVTRSTGPRAGTRTRVRCSEDSLGTPVLLPLSPAEGALCVTRHCASLCVTVEVVWRTCGATSVFTGSREFIFMFKTGKNVINETLLIDNSRTGERRLLVCDCDVHTRWLWPWLITRQ